MNPFSRGSSILVQRRRRALDSSAITPRLAWLVGFAALSSGCKELEEVVEFLVAIVIALVALWATLYGALWIVFLATCIHGWRRRADVGVARIVEGFGLVLWHGLAIVLVNEPPAWLVASIAVPIGALLMSFVAYALGG